MANDTDAASIAEMEARCFSDPWSLDYLENLLRNPAVHFVVAESDGVPAGYFGITVIVDECEVLNVAVLPEYRRKGIGRTLMEEIICICRRSSVTSLFLEHRESNTAAAALYESLGFAEYGRRKNYYDSPTEDAILRKLTLE